jgi:hypothetical protein
MTSDYARLAVAEILELGLDLPDAGPSVVERVADA